MKKEVIKLPSLCYQLRRLRSLSLSETIILSTIFGFKSGIEDLFVEESADAVLTTVPGRPSLGTLSAFTIISFLGLFTLSAIRLRKRIYRYGGAVVAALGSVAFLGYLLNAPILYYTLRDVSTAMAVHTAALFVLLGFGYIFLTLKSKAKKNDET